MSFEVDRYSSAWAHIALCADLTWATEPPDEFIIANQRLWAHHCRVSQVLQDAAIESQTLPTNNQYELTDNRVVSNQNQENGCCSGRISVKDVIPESRLAQFYGNFYYDEIRERCYTNPNEKTYGRGHDGQRCENNDPTECWMLPEVEYWFRKLLDDSSERGMCPRRRRQCKKLVDDDFERWSPAATARPASEEAALAARVFGVRALWTSNVLPSSAPVQLPRALSPPPAPRKIRARRRQPRRLAALAPPLPAYYLEAPAQLLCDPACKFQFDSPRPQLTECQRAMGRLSASVQALMRATAARCPPYRGTNVSRYAPTYQRPARYADRRNSIWWPRNHPSSRQDHRFRLARINLNNITANINVPATKQSKENKNQEPIENKDNSNFNEQNNESCAETQKTDETTDITELPKSPQKEKNATDSQAPSTSATPVDAGMRKKRLYSTVLSMSAPSPMNLTAVGSVRLPPKLVTHGLLKLNPKIMLPAARIRPQVVDHKFEELEKEALEQYKESDESIDTKFHELEKQAVEQYSTSNSNTSCSSGNSAEKRNSTPSVNETDMNHSKHSAKFHKEEIVDSVVIYSQNFPDFNVKGQTTSLMNLKNFHGPPRGEKKEQVHRLSKPTKSLRCDSKRAASDTDYDSREANAKTNHKSSMRWTVHVMPPKKRHLTLCVSDFSSDEEDGRSIKNAGPRVKNHVAGKLKISAHGGGDLNPIMRKT